MFFLISSPFSPHLSKIVLFAEIGSFFLFQHQIWFHTLCKKKGEEVFFFPTTKIQYIYRHSHSIKYVCLIFYNFPLQRDSHEYFSFTNCIHVTVLFYNSSKWQRTVAIIFVIIRHWFVSHILKTRYENLNTLFYDFSVTR